MELKSEHVKSAVPLAVLGSIAIVVASFIQNLEFVKSYEGFWSPFPFYLISGLLLLISSSSYLIYKHGVIKLNLLFYDIFFEGGLYLGLIGFFIASLVTLILYF